MMKPWQAAIAPPAPRATTAWVSAMTSKPRLFDLCVIAHFAGCQFASAMAVAVSQWCCRRSLKLVSGRQALLLLCSITYSQRLSRQSQPRQSAGDPPACMLLCLPVWGRPCWIEQVKMLPARVPAHSSMAHHRQPPCLSAQYCAKVLASIFRDKLHNGLFFLHCRLL